MINGKTKSGFEFELEDDALNDMELLEDLAKIDEGGKESIVGMPKVLVRLLGEDGKQRLYNHVRNEKGRVTVDAVLAEFEDVLNASKTLKN